MPTPSTRRPGLGAPRMATAVRIKHPSPGPARLSRPRLKGRRRGNTGTGFRRCNCAWRRQQPCLLRAPPDCRTRQQPAQLGRGPGLKGCRIAGGRPGAAVKVDEGRGDESSPTAKTAGGSGDGAPDGAGGGRAARGRDAVRLPARVGRVAESPELTKPSRSRLKAAVTPRFKEPNGSAGHCRPEAGSPRAPKPRLRPAAVTSVDRSRVARRAGTR